MNEDKFFNSLFTRLPALPPEVAIGPGDDCAALAISDRQLLLIAVDQLVGDRHYRLQNTDPDTPFDAGRKLLARNLSDIAAMGGIPRYCLTAVALAPQQDVQWLNQFMDGILALAKQYNMHMIGGDLATAPHDAVASLTILGDVQKQDVISRRGARTNDRILVTGTFGSSLNTGHHLKFTPRCNIGQWLARQHFATAMIDVSDGLLLDLGRVCRASGVSARIAPETVPRRTPGTTEEQALTDGEDYELLFAVSPDIAPLLQAKWPFPGIALTDIGVFTEPNDDLVCTLQGRPVAANGKTGFDHLESRP